MARGTSAYRLAHSAFQPDSSQHSTASSPSHSLPAHLCSTTNTWLQPSTPRALFHLSFVLRSAFFPTLTPGPLSLPPSSPSSSVLPLLDSLLPCFPTPLPRRHPSRLQPFNRPQLYLVICAARPFFPTAPPVLCFPSHNNPRTAITLPLLSSSRRFPASVLLKTQEPYRSFFAADSWRKAASKVFDVSTFPSATKHHTSSLTCHGP